VILGLVDEAVRAGARQETGLRSPGHRPADPSALAAERCG